MAAKESPKLQDRVQFLNDLLWAISLIGKTPGLHPGIEGSTPSLSTLTSRGIAVGIKPMWAVTV